MISVALCTYNGEKYIKQQMESIIRQTIEPDEIVICDDCSTDNTVNILKQLLNDWKGTYTIIKNEHNLGFRKNFEKAISLCQGDLIFLSDQDDVWNLHKIEIIKNVFDNDSAVNLVFHDAQVVDKNLNVIRKSFWKILSFDYSKFALGDYRRLQHSNIVQGSACAFRKKIFFDATPFPIEAYHDEWLALISLLQGQIVAVPQQLLLYRQSGNNAVGAQSETFCKKIKKWLTHVHKLSLEHFNEMVRREKIGHEYEMRSLRITNRQSEFSDYYQFLKQRIYYLEKKNWGVLLKFLDYISVSANLTLALKIWIKDLLYLLIHMSTSNN